MKDAFVLREITPDVTVDLSPAGFVCPSSMVELNGRFVVVDQYAHKLVFISREGEKIKEIGGKGKGLGQFHYPTTVCVDDDLCLWVTDRWNHRLHKLSSDGKPISCFGCYGEGKGEFSEPWGVTYHNGFVYVSDRNNHRVQVFDKTGEFTRSFGVAGPDKSYFEGTEFKKGFVYEIWNRDSAKYKTFENFFFKDNYKIGTLEYPLNIYVSCSGFVFVVDSSNGCVRKFNLDGGLVFSYFQDLLGFGTDILCDVIVFDDGTAVISSELSDKAVVIDQSGKLLSCLKTPKGKINYMCKQADGVIWGLDSWNKFLHQFKLR